MFKSSSGFYSLFHGASFRIVPFFLLIPFLLGFAQNQLVTSLEKLEPLEVTSVTGQQVSLQASEGKILLLHCWNTGKSESPKNAIELLLLYQRFHEKGLEVMGICTDSSAESVLSFSRKWQIPWPLVLNTQADGMRLTERLRIPEIPCNLVVNAQGGILAQNLAGEKAHQVIADLLGVALNGPAQPERSQIQTEPVSLPASTQDEAEHEGWLYIKEGMGLVTGAPGYSIARHVPPGKEEQALRDQGWLSNLIAGPLDIETPNQVLPLRGKWYWNPGESVQSTPEIAHTLLLFSPVMANGEIRLQAIVNTGQEGVRIIFGYQSPNRYFVWNIGGWDNTCSVVEKWSALHEQALEEITPRAPFHLPPGQWHDIRLVLDSSEKQVEGYLDGAQIMKCVIPESFEGRLGIGTWKTQADFHSIRITGTGSSAPVYPASLMNPKEFFNKLGIRVQWDQPGTPGIPIYAVVFNSPAFMAGLQSDDVITAVEGIPLDDPSQYRAIIEKALAQAADQGRSAISLSVSRGRSGESRTVSLSTIRRVTPRHDPWQNPPGLFAGGMGMGGYGMMGVGNPMPNPAYNQQVQQMIADQQWEDTPWTGSLTVQSDEQFLPLRGGWIQRGNTFVQTDITAQPAVLLFSPYLQSGELRLRAKTTGGAEGVRIIFGFAPLKPYYVWNIGGWNNQYTGIELWHDLDNYPGMNVFQENRFTFTPGVWHEIRVVFNAETRRLDGYVDSQNVISTQLDLPIEGRLGVGTWGTLAEFQSIQILGPDADPARPVPAPGDIPSSPDESPSAAVPSGTPP